MVKGAVVTGVSISICLKNELNKNGIFGFNSPIGHVDVVNPMTGVLETVYVFLYLNKDIKTLHSIHHPTLSKMITAKSVDLALFSFMEGVDYTDQKNYRKTNYVKGLPVMDYCINQCFLNSRTIFNGLVISNGVFLIDYTNSSNGLHLTFKLESGELMRKTIETFFLSNFKEYVKNNEKDVKEKIKDSWYRDTNTKITDIVFESK